MEKQHLQDIGDKIRATFDAKDDAREQAFALSREVIRNSANAIRAIHREEYEEALDLMDKTAKALAQIDKVLAEHLDVYWAGFVHDAQKEYAEARATYALIHRDPLPHPDDVGVSYAAYLNGLGEAVGELRRHILDEMRSRGPGWGEEMLSAMDDVYYLLASMDYPNAISGNLKRTTDVTRSIIEKTRGDLTAATRAQHLEKAMTRLEERLKSESD
ncbi:MAG: haloacid dehalogenase [Armatimonadetes bacterium]|nr:haloacid dehalogenase [Armatimonadota bacterium]NIM24170.1 haloacid dehalogenase [Armatimonadota bacterium]NIM68029.1 haloacid dehalogenase [Armatimonadota bacterium]NIM76524.1 haloacid dehalogenase [Armatimonadota bacterium]NIN06263.1 haloacid dehalogenase [Armatimonadota bacterium]